MQTELIKLAVVIVVLLVILFVLRRASARSRAREPHDVRERLGVEPAVEAKPRRRPRPGEPEAAPEARPAAEAPPTEPAAPVDVEAREAYKAGLAKTRSGFVARLGKLFGKKKIDAETIDELEQVLFTADIGPRAADRIFQAVKSGLSRDELDDSAR